MGFPFKWVAEERWHREPAQVIALEMNPERVQPALSVQPQWNKSLGIIRGLKEKGFLVEDHIREMLDESGRLIDVGQVGLRIFGADEMRRQVWTVDQHLSAYQETHPRDRVVAWVGNGNLLNNPHFVGFAGGLSQGTLYHLASEERHFTDPLRPYSCVVVRREGFKPRVNIETLFFKREGGTPQVLSADARLITHEIEYATFGQRLVEQGTPIDEEKLVEMARSQQFYDLRHLFLFGRIDRGEKRWMDAGLTGFWDDKGQMDTQAVEDAIRGRPISVDVKQFPENTVHKAMADKGYCQVPGPKHPGQCSAKGDLLEVVLREGIYPHNMIGIREDGKVISVVLRGLSNRVGVTIRGAATVMKMLRAQEALLMDNGGDVMMSFGNDLVLGSAEGERNRLRSIILFSLSPGVGRLEPGDLRLVKYPKQLIGGDPTAT